MDCSPPGLSVHGISQARILEWVAVSFFGGSSRPRDQTQVSCIGRQIPAEPAGSPVNSVTHRQLPRSILVLWSRPCPQRGCTQDEQELCVLFTSST